MPQHLCSYSVVIIGDSTTTTDEENEAYAYLDATLAEVITAHIANSPIPCKAKLTAQVYEA